MLDSNVAIEQVVSLLGVIDSEPMYDYGTILNRFKEPANSDTIYFSGLDVLLDYLGNSLVDEQSRFLKQLKADVEGESEEISSRMSVVSSLNCNRSKSINIPAAVLAKLIQLCLFSSDNESSLSEILEAQNGVFGSTSDPFPSLLAGYQAYASYNVVEAVRAVQIDLTKIGDVVNDFSEKAQMKELRKRMLAVHLELERLYDESNPGSDSLMGSVGSLASDVKSAVESYYKEDWAQFAKSTISAFQYLGNSSDTKYSGNDAWIQREELDQIRSEMHSVSNKAFEIKNSLLSSEAWALSEIQDAADSRRAIDARAAGSFPVLLHLALLEELRLPSQDARIFVSRLEGIRDFVEHYPDENQELGIGFDSLSSCDETWFDIEIEDYVVDTPFLFPSNCLTIHHHSEQFVVYGRVNLGELDTNIPLFFYQPTADQHAPIKKQVPLGISNISVQRQ